MVGQMKDFFETDVFGVEKEAGKVEGIIAAVYQSVFGQDAYPSRGCKKSCVFGK